MKIKLGNHSRSSSVLLNLTLISTCFMFSSHFQCTTDMTRGKKEEIFTCRVKKLNTVFQIWGTVGQACWQGVSIKTIISEIRCKSLLDIWVSHRLTWLGQFTPCRVILRTCLQAGCQEVGIKLQWFLFRSSLLCSHGTSWLSLSWPCICSLQKHKYMPP